VKSPKEDMQRARQRWMRIMAQGPFEELARYYADLKNIPAHECVKGPETGTYMLTGRIAGTGDPFHFGEVTVTRCIVRTKEGFTGVAYILGKNLEHARLAALLDAMLQNPDRRNEVERRIVRPIEKNQKKRIYDQRRRVAATRVNFFTMARGE